jgi:hypothetical protein
MSEHIEFTPNGLVLHKWNRDKRKFVRKRPKKLTIVTHLRSRCEIAEGTTLRQIFEAVDKYKFLKLVIAQYSWCRQLDAFHAQAQEPQRFDPDDTDPMEYLEIYHHPEVHKFTEKKKHPGGTRERTVTIDFDTSVGFHGIGPAPKGKEDDLAARPDGNIQYSVSYSPMWKLADLPVKLNKSFDVYEPFDSNRPGSGREKLLTASREYTLLEVLDAIYWDISFMGGPSDNADFLEQMNETMDQIRSGEVPLIPIEQVFTDLKEETPDAPQEDEPKKMKVLMHPDVARLFGCDPDSIPLDDKEIIRDDES